MKRNLMKAGLLLAVLLSQSHTATASTQLFNATMQGVILTVTTNIPNHLYPTAGIKVNTPGYTANANVGLAQMVPASSCTDLGNGFCQFTASNSSPTQLVISSTTTPPFIKATSPAPTTVPVSITLCLNARGPLSCQTQIFAYSNVT